LTDSAVKTSERPQLGQKGISGTFKIFWFSVNPGSGTLPIGMMLITVDPLGAFDDKFFRLYVNIRIINAQTHIAIFVSYTHNANLALFVLDGQILSF
jgi:hypothetical protein